MTTGTRVGWGAHLRGVRSLPEMSEVEWSATAEVRFALKEAAIDRGLVVVTGRVGVGKTFSVARAAEALTDAVDEVVWLELSSNIRGRALLAALYPDLAGGPPSRGDTEHQLMAGLHAAIADRHRLLVVDEAQHISRQAMHTLRGLHSHPDADCALVLVGTPELNRRLPPELRSRRTASVTLDGLADDEVASVLAAYHPIFAAAAPAVLMEANRRFARGEMRWWAKLLVRAARDLEAGEELTMDVLIEVGQGL